LSGFGLMALKQQKKKGCFYFGFVNMCLSPNIDCSLNPCAKSSHASSGVVAIFVMNFPSAPVSIALEWLSGDDYLEWVRCLQKKQARECNCLSASLDNISKRGRAFRCVFHSRTVLINLKFA
jgi:hypothetical protein